MLVVLLQSFLPFLFFLVVDASSLLVPLSLAVSFLLLVLC